MTNMVPFPGGEDRMRREIERDINSRLDISKPALRDCITTRIAAVLARNPGIPTLSVNAALPIGVTEADVKSVVDAFQKEYSEKVHAYGIGLLRQICLPEARLCAMAHGTHSNR